MPLELQRVLNLVTQHYKGHVTIVAQPSLQSFKNILTNPNYQEYEEAIHSSYICTLQSKLFKTHAGYRDLFDPSHLRS